MIQRDEFYTHSDDGDFEQKTRDLLLFHKVVKVEGGDQNAELTLDNGVKLYTEGNRGCGGCGNGWYYLVALNNCDNAITNVEACIDHDDNLYCDTYRLFVYAKDKKINLVQYEGEDNGYYGTGYDVYVNIPKETKAEI